MRVNLKLLFPAMILICCSRSFAQAYSEDVFKKFSFLAGANASNMNFNNSATASATTAVPSSWKTGLSIGIGVRVELFDNLYFQPQYFYMQRKGADMSKSFNYTIDYLSLPVLLNYSVSPRFSFFAGPQFDLSIRANAQAGGINSTITHDVEERSIGITGGIEVELIKSFFISLRYIHGLNNIGIGQRSTVKEFKYQGVNVVAGIRF